MIHGKIVFKEKNGCKLTVKLGGLNVAKGLYVKHWVMFSPVTGRHSIDTFYSQPCKRVLTHWAGFLANQPK